MRVKKQKLRTELDANDIVLDIFHELAEGILAFSESWEINFLIGFIIVSGDRLWSGIVDHEVTAAYVDRLFRRRKDSSNWVLHIFKRDVGKASWTTIRMSFYKHKEMGVARFFKTSNSQLTNSNIDDLSKFRKQPFNFIPRRRPGKVTNKYGIRIWLL